VAALFGKRRPFVKFARAFVSCTCLCASKLLFSRATERYSKMSSDLDPAKLKVVELRAELQLRGLDVKGNKPVLVKRLKDALESELHKEIPDTSIADTSTEDLNTSQDEDDKPDTQEKEPSPKKKKVKESEPEPEPASEPGAASEPEEDETVTAVQSEPEQPKEEESEAPEIEEEAEPTKEDVDESETDAPAAEPEPTTEEEKEESKENIEENGTNGDAVDEDSSETKNRKSRWGADADEAKVVEAEPMEQQPADTPEKTADAWQEEVPHGEKRKHSPSPERPVQRKRSKSPAVEDEPTIDSSKVQLSWCK